MENKFSNTLRDLGRSVRGGAETVRDYAKIKYSIAREQGEINELISELGTLAYESLKNGEPIPPKEYKLICDAIDDGYAAIEKLEEEKSRVLGDGADE